MSEESRTGLDPDRIPKRRGLHIHDIKEEEPEPDSTVGAELREARTAAGKSLEDVGTALRIRPELLEALETGQISKLPGRPYAIGFVRSYSELMGLDSDDLVSRFKRELDTSGQSVAEAADAAAAAVASVGRHANSRGRTGTGAETGDEQHVPPLTIAVVVLLLIAVIFGGWYLTRPSGGEEQPAPSGKGAADESAEKPAPSANLLPSPASRPPVLPVAEKPSARPDGSSGSSLSALLPGGAAAGTSAAEGGAGDAAPANSVTDGPSGFAAPVMPAAASAGDAPASGEETVSDGGAAPASGDAAAGSGEIRSDRLTQAAMPSPNLNLRTETSRAPDRALAGDNAPRTSENPDEPALEEIEADSVGGAVEGEAPPPPPPAAKPKPGPKKPQRQEAEVFGAANVRSRVTLRMLSSAWVQVVDGQGRVIIEREMRSGDSFRAPDVDNLYLVTEDAGAVELLLDGRSIGQAGVAKQVLTGLLLEPNQLEKRVAANIAAQSQP